MNCRTHYRRLLIILLVSITIIGFTTPVAANLQADSNLQQQDSPIPEYCAEFLQDSITQCLGSSEERVEIDYTHLDTDLSGKAEFKVTPNNLPEDISIRAKIDGSDWSESSGSPMYVDREYPANSYQYPTITVQLRTEQGTIVSTKSIVISDGVYIQNANTRNPVPDDDEDSEKISTVGEVTVFDDSQNTIQRPTYSYVSRFNDNDGVQENNEDDTIPPIGYDTTLQIRGPIGNVTDFNDLRAGNDQPAIFASDRSVNQMRLGTAMLGVPSGEYGKVRVDYGLQTESATQNVQINLVNRYGEVIDESMEDSSSRRLYNTITTNSSSDYFSEGLQYRNALDEDLINTQTIEFTLTYEERQYVEENNELYMTYNTNQRAYLLLYRTPLITQSTTDAQNNNWVPNQTFFEKDFDNNLGNDTPATFDASYEVSGNENPEYDTYDRTPGEQLELEVDVTNSGDTLVRRDIGIFSKSEHNASADIIDSRVVTVEPNSSTQFTITKQWEPHEYGNHSITVVDTTETPRKIAKEGGSTANTDVYVLQPATFNITNVYHPPNWLIYDNFNVTVVVENVGDLSGSGVVKGDFQNWKGEMVIPETEGGIVRKNLTGNSVPITFDRNGTDYSPSYPEVPEDGPVNPRDRPNSPYGTQLTYPPGENTTIDSNFTANVTHPFAEPNNDLHESLNDSVETETIRIYKMEMITLEIENGHTDNRTWFGSGAPETDLINRTAWPAGHTADQHDIVGFPQGMMPTIGNAKIVYSPLNVDMNEANWYEDRRMTAKVRVLNNGTADTGVARVKITTNKSGIKGGNVVGTAGLDLTGREEEKWIDVPIVIPNDENNGGTHNLTAEVRTTPDYIRPYPNEFINNSVNPTINETLSVETDIRLWADFIAEDVQVSQNVLNEQCYQEGTDGSGDALRCDTTQEEKLDITGFWENYGGITGDKFQANVKITTETDQSGACNVGPCTGESDFQNLEFVDNIENISGIEQRDFWVTQTKYIDPTENQSFAANEIPFNEPGVYRVAGIPHRKNQENSSLDKYENSTKAPTDQHEIIKVLDITHPESDANIKEKYFRCKNTISCLNTESAGQSNWNIWEGGMITFTGDPSKDNVRIVEYRWWLNDGPLNTGYTDCDGANCYSTGGEASDKIHGRDIRHRFNETGDFTLRLRTKDDPAYGTGAKVNTTGTPNTDTDTFNLTVKPDNNPPDVRVYDDYHNNPDNSPDSDTVWRVNEETQYDGIEVCSTAEQSDDEIGIESDEWWGVEVDDGDSVPDDTRCRFWETTGDKEIQYEAWDFANNSNSDQYTVDVQEDRTPPSVDLSVSKPNRWVEKDDWTNGITWSADTEDEETGLINCYETNNDPYSWFRDTNGDSNDCSTEFTTSYSSASESGTDFEVSIRARDYHGNSKVDSKEITLYEDKTDPSASGDVDVCSSGYNQDGCTAQACVTPSDNGPFGGIGISKTTGAGGDGCIEVTADANANADASTPSSCGDTNVDVATASDSDSDTATVTVYDYHGNTDTATISVSATDEDRDVDSASSSPCGNSSSGGSP